MSEDESGSAEGGSGLTTMYRCRHCPGQEFTAPERDQHRQMHRRTRKRRGSPNLTLFEPVTVVGDTPSGTQTEVPPPKKKGRQPITPKKRYNSQKAVKSDGG